MRQFALTMLAVLAVGCSTDARPLTSPDRPAEGSVAYVQLSNASPAAGSTIIVAVRVNGAANVTKIGSFTARLRFDANALEYAGEAAMSGGMRMLKPAASEILAAGAAAGGFDDGVLFAAQFKVRDPAGLAALTLVDPELTGVSFGAQTSKRAIDRRLFSR